MRQLLSLELRRPDPSAEHCTSDRKQSRQESAKKSGYAVTGYIVSEASGSNTDYQVNNVYYCNDADRHTGGDLGGWYGYYKQGTEQFLR